jgi:hypothetical protein
VEAASINVVGTNVEFTSELVALNEEVFSKTNAREGVWKRVVSELVLFVSSTAFTE